MDEKLPYEGVKPYRYGGECGEYKAAEDTGRKYDADKTDWSLLPWRSVEQIVRILMFGAQKYDRDNWRLVPNGKTRYFSALMRHLTAHANGEKTDAESGLTHLAHAGCCLLFLMELDNE